MHICIVQMYGDAWAKVQRALEIWSGLGMSLTGVHTCGDYMFSGHTVVLTMLNFFVTECEYADGVEILTNWKISRTSSTLSAEFQGYEQCLFFILDTPRNWNFIHTMSWVLNLFGIFFILAAHEHYSIDVFIAFYLTTRLFLYYHTLANTQAYQHSRRARIWFPLFSFFECNVTGPVPNEYGWPFSKPVFIRMLLG